MIFGNTFFVKINFMDTQHRTLLRANWHITLEFPQITLNQSTIREFCTKSICIDFLSKFGEILLQEYVSERTSHPGHLRWSSLQIKELRRVKCEANFVSSGSKIVKCLRSRKYDPVIIEEMMDLVLYPSTALYRSVLKHCSLTNKAGFCHRTESDLFLFSWIFLWL